MRKGWICLGLAVATASAGAQTPATTVQQDFEAAAALDAKGDRTAALAAWTRLEARTKPGSRSRGIALVRKGGTLFALDDLDAAATATREGLKLLPANDASLATDRWRAYYALGSIARRALDYAGASDAFAQAEAVAPDASYKLGAMLALAETTTFTDPDRAAGVLDRVDALAKANPADPVVKSMIARRHALLLLNQGQFEPARLRGVEAVKLLGGLTERTDSRDVSARSDVAIAALLAGKSDSAREYMAMTGAGRLSKGDFDPAVQMDVPSCGGEAQLKPADMAVVEFSVRDDGVVTNVAPIYAAGGGTVALEFARAVRDWSWTPEQVRQWPLFFRTNVRVEMRCSTAFERPSIARFLDTDLRAWLASKGQRVPDAKDGADAVQLSRQRAALATVEATSGATSLAALPPLYALIVNSVVGREETHALARRAVAIAQANDAPALARLPLELALRTSESTDSFKEGAYARVVAPLASDPVYAGDAQARSAIRLLVADRERNTGRRTAMVQAVVDDKGLAATDPMRVGALIRLASIQQQAGQVAAARASFAQSGLAANQCAILDAPPRPLAAGGNFPQEAMRWGFEGWVRTQFDVGAEGKVLNERAVLSYPPFVFTKAGTQTIAGSRWSKTFRPDGGIGCGSLSRSVRFVM